MDRIPTGIPEPLIVGRGIDDVAIVVLTLTPRPEAAIGGTRVPCTRVARELRVAVSKLDDVGLTYIVGGTTRADPSGARSRGARPYGVTLQQLAARSKAQTGRSRPDRSATVDGRCR